MKQKCTLTKKLTNNIQIRKTEESFAKKTKQRSLKYTKAPHSLTVLERKEGHQCEERVLWGKNPLLKLGPRLKCTFWSRGGNNRPDNSIHPSRGCGGGGELNDVTLTYFLYRCDGWGGGYAVTRIPMRSTHIYIYFSFVSMIEPWKMFFWLPKILSD